MSRRISGPTQAEISRAVKAVQATGLPVVRVEIEGSKIVVLTASAGSEPAQPENAYEKWREKQRAAKERKSGPKKAG